MSKNIVDLFIALGFFILFTVFSLALKIAVEQQNIYKELMYCTAMLTTAMINCTYLILKYGFKV